MPLIPRGFQTDNGALFLVFDLYYLDHRLLQLLMSASFRSAVGYQPYLCWYLILHRLSALMLLILVFAIVHCVHLVVSLSVAVFPIDLLHWPVMLTEALL